jgi:hypothetical protein
MGRQLKKGTTVISYEGSNADQGETLEPQEVKAKEAVS